MGYLVFYLSVCGKNAQNYKIFEDSDKFSTFYSFSISILFFFLSQHVHTATPALVSTVLLVEDVSPISLIVLTLVNLQVR